MSSIRPSTFSIVAADPVAGEIGVAVQSRFLAVGAVAPWLASDAGAVATQAWANTSYGPRGLELLRRGLAPEAVVRELTEADDDRQERQLGVVALDGRSATYTGSRCMDWAGGVAGDGFAAQGNILAGPAVVDAMAKAFAGSNGALADRLLAALAAGQLAGGDRRGQQSAALLVGKPKGGYGGFNDRFIDLRVDDHVAPIDELARLLELHKLYFFAAAPGDVLAVDDALGTALVALLAEVGALEPSDGAGFGDVARTALVRFMHRENLEGRVRDDGTIDRQTLEYLRSAARERRR
ncbi:MAG: DUF1028 domain-containing protein [Candidatus Baltobacteraceae bacterium]